MAYFDGSQFAILKRHNGMYTTLAYKAFSAHANTSYDVRLVAASGKLTANIWQASGLEPTSWILTANDSTFSTGYGGIRAGLANNASASLSSFYLTHP